MTSDPDRTSDDDLRRIVRLLWRHTIVDDDHGPGARGRRGPRPRVSVDEVVAAAIAIADRDGLSKVSIRGVADDLGLGPMSLYTYVPSKDALTALMVDEVAAEDDPIDMSAPLRDRMAAIAHQFRDEAVRHPWLLDVAMWRPSIGPHLSARYERHLAAVDGVGLDDLDMDSVVAVLQAFATGNARVRIEAERTRAASGTTDLEWWEAVAPILGEVMPADAFPLGNRVGSAVGERFQAPGDADVAFEFGLERLLDGIERQMGHGTDARR
ncbi:TetR/AcrR family transcriptional regulator C-terminal domain-containing protein [Gordonia soli]|uniref:Putative TetR family transcriptional regulator n=1 Tax=Gordonia soli NBRC 108243 TaxID=1223545 RepID=M0QMP1_9ACTN|nr:TetR/AcrR family transcriptional regulator C-terminal domain-containing protein [Gordonia soli]GAC69905.1 putative TetR family transcriptional regulator [Gordonia soli NBRC 108243]